jgi:DNA-binding CsgD family transcriptional regulator
MLEATGYLPKRNKKGHWINTFIPIKSASTKISLLFVLVLEVTHKRELEDALGGLAARLLYVKENLRTSVQETRTARGNSQTESETRLLQSLELIEKSATDVADILRILRPTASFRHYPDSLRLPVSWPASVPPALPHDTWNPDRLSPRERQVLVLLASNHVNKQIASNLQISVRTVETHRRRLMERLGLHSVSELVHYAIRHGFVPL